MKKRIAKKSAAPKVKVKVKKVMLPATAVLEVVVPKGLVPVVATDPDKGIVKIIPVPAAKLADTTWLERWLGWARAS